MGSYRATNSSSVPQGGKGTSVAQQGGGYSPPPMMPPAWANRAPTPLQPGQYGYGAGINGSGDVGASTMPGSAPQLAAPPPMGVPTQAQMQQQAQGAPSQAQMLQAQQQQAQGAPSQGGKGTSLAQQAGGGSPPPPLMAQYPGPPAAGAAFGPPTPYTPPPYTPQQPTGPTQAPTQAQAQQAQAQQAQAQQAQGAPSQGGKGTSLAQGGMNQSQLLLALQNMLGMQQQQGPRPRPPIRFKRGGRVRKKVNSVEHALAVTRSKT